MCLLIFDSPLLFWDFTVSSFHAVFPSHLYHHVVFDIPVLLSEKYIISSPFSECLFCCIMSL